MQLRPSNLIRNVSTILSADHLREAFSAAFEHSRVNSRPWLHEAESSQSTKGTAEALASSLRFANRERDIAPRPDAALLPDFRARTCRPKAASLGMRVPTGESNAVPTCKARSPPSNAY